MTLRLIGLIGFRAIRTTIRTVSVLLSFCHPLLAASTPTDLGQYYGFGPMEILKLEWGMGLPQIADINQDGLNDLAIVNNRKARIDILLQKADYTGADAFVPEPEDEEDINDIYGKERNWRFKRLSHSLDFKVTSLLITDMNRDGHIDLVYYSSNGLFVTLQEAARDDKRPTETTEPKWQAPIRIEISDGQRSSRALSSGDLNHDGFPDVALLADDGVYLILQDGRGGLEKPLKYYSEGAKYLFLDTADLDGDGREDIVLLTADREYPVVIRYQNQASRLGPQRRYRFPAPRSLRLRRLHDSGRHHLISVARQSGRVLVSTLAEQSQQEELQVLTYPLPKSEKGGNRDIVTGDLNGDSILDVVVTDPERAEFLLYRGDTEVGLKGPEQFPGFKDMRKISAGDLQGNGQDAVIVLSVDEKLIGISQLEEGRLSFPEIVDIEGKPQAMDVADMNGDGELDLAYISQDKKEGNTQYLFRTVLSIGSSSALAGVELTLTDIEDAPLDMRIADIDHNGLADILIVRPYGPLHLILQSERNTFVEVEKDKDTHSGLMANIYPNTLALAPLGPDGKAAVLVTQKNFSRSLWFNENKGWQVLDQYQSARHDSNLTTSIAGKIFNDTTMKVLSYDSARGKIMIMARSTDGTYRTDKEIDVGAVKAKEMSIGCFGGDPGESLLLAGENKLVLVPVSARARILREVATFEPDIKDAQLGPLDVGDLNQDGNPEIVLLDQARHHVAILTFDEDAALVPALKFKVFESPRGVSNDLSEGKTVGEPRGLVISDVTGDSRNDIILLIHDRLIIYPQD